MIYSGTIALKASNGQNVFAQNGGGGAVGAGSANLSMWEIFTLIDRGNGQVTLQAFTGHYFMAQNGGGGAVVASSTNLSTWETFRLLDRGNGQVALQALNGQYVCAEGGGGGALVANRNAIGAWETFTLIDLSSSIVICQGRDYGTPTQALALGAYDLNVLSIGNDQLSSIIVPAGMKVTLYEHAGFTGRTKTFTQNTAYVGDDFNDITSGVKVEKSAGVAPPNVLAFDGTSCFGESQVNISETECTVSVWFKTTNKNCGIYTVDAGDRGATGYDRSIWLNDGFICTRIWNNESIRTTRNTFADGSWHKVTHVYGRAIGGQRIYIDGQLEATGLKASSDFNWQDGINVGYANDASNPYFAGEISEVAIWGIARSEREIISKTETLVGNETGLLAYWSFKDGRGNIIPNRVKGKPDLLVRGQVNWQHAEDFSGVFIPVVQPAVVKSIRDEGKRITDTVKPISEGYKTLPADTTVPKPLSQLIGGGGLLQYDAGKRVQNAIQGNKVTLSKELLGEFAEAGNLVGSLMNAFVSISNPAVTLVKIKPGTSGEDGETLGSNPATNLSLATAQTTALHISGDTTLFSGLNVQLKYAEFSQLKGKPYGVFKFVGKTPVGVGVLLPNVPLLDAMVIYNPTIILSSTGDVKDTQLNTGLAKGFNFFGNVKLGESNSKAFKFIGGFLGIADMQLHGSVDLSASTPAYLVESAIAIDKYIINGSNFKVKFSKAALGLSIKGKPLEPALLLSNEVIITLKKGSELTNLVFTGGLKFEAESVTGSFTMQAQSAEAYASLSGNVVAQGEWKNPFGILGITIRELALQAGLTYAAPWIDNIGVHGNLKIGDVDGSMSVLVDTNDPDQFVLAGATDHITIFQLMSAMSPLTLLGYSAIPSNIKNVLDKFVNLSLDNVKINIVPTATSIGAIDFEEGITVMGKLTAWGWHASVFINIDYQEGLAIRGEMDNINLYNVLKITGAQNDPSPILSLTLSPKSIPNLLISSKIYLLGLSQEVQITGNEAGLSFNFNRSISNILDTNLACTFGDGGNLVASGSINFKLNVSIPTVFGNISLVNVGMNASTTMKVGPTYGFDTTISGSFSVYGKSVTMPTLNLKVAPNDFQGLYNAVIKQITDNAAAIFNSVFGTLAEWANAVKSGVIQYSGEIASVAKNVYRASERDVIAAYQTLGKSTTDIANGLKNVYGYSSQGVATALKGAGYAADQVGSGLKSAYGASEQGVAIALKGAGYTVDQVGSGVKSAYGSTAQGVATALRGAGYSVNETGNFVKNAYGLSADALNTALGGAGYAADEIKGFFNNLGGEFADYAHKTWDVIKSIPKVLDPTGW